MDGSIVGWLRRQKLKTVGEEVWTLTDHGLAEIEFLLKAGHIGETDRRVEAVFAAGLGVGNGGNCFTTRLAAD